MAGAPTALRLLACPDFQTIDVKGNQMSVVRQDHKRALHHVVAVMVGCVVAALFLFGTTSAGADGTNGGAAVPTDPGDNLPLTTGGSATSWTLNLPAQAACSGDTASGGFHVYSYVVPSSVDPATLTFNPSTGPSSGNPLVDTTGTAYMAANTATITGQVIQVPNFNWSLFATTDQGGTKIVLAPGRLQRRSRVRRHHRSRRQILERRADVHRGRSRSRR